MRKAAPSRSDLCRSLSGTPFYSCLCSSFPPCSTIPAADARADGAVEPVSVRICYTGLIRAASLWAASGLWADQLTDARTNKELRDALAYHHEKVSGTKAEMLKRIAGVCVRLYEKHEGKLSKLFKDRYVRLNYNATDLQRQRP